MTGNETRDLRIHAVNQEADGIISIDLRAPDGAELPAFTAGSHIDLVLPNNITRSYSLINPQGERNRYVVAVNRDAKSRGGSTFVHDNLRVGDVVPVRGPRNNFNLREDAKKTVLIAGGIGVTPLYCMAQRLAELGRPWELYYSARMRQNAAFLAALGQLAEKSGGKLHLNFDLEPGGKMLDLGAIVGTVDAEADLYCCGPVPMLEAFEKACAGRAPERVHVEYFSNAEPLATGGGFTVELKGSGKSFTIPEGETILDVLLDAGVQVSFSCREGTCGTCETKVLEGVPDHRDIVLSQAEKDSNKTMMVCCSGSKTPKLVLDL